MKPLEQIMGYTNYKELEVLINVFSLYIVPLHFSQCILRYFGTLSHYIQTLTTLPSYTTTYIVSPLLDMWIIFQISD